MLGPSRKYGKIEDKLEEALLCIFTKQFNPASFFPLLAEIADDPDLKLPANLIFSIYNLLVREQPQTAYNCLDHIENQNPHSVANVAGFVVRSAYQSYSKKYFKSQVDSLMKAVQLCEQLNLDREFIIFYGEAIARMIQIYQFGAFRREYYAIMDKLLTRYQSEIENNQILKMISTKKQSLKTKICSIQKLTHINDFSVLKSNSTKISKFTFRKKQDNKLAHSKSREKSSDSSKVSNSISPRAKFRSSNFMAKPKKYVNPYGLHYNESQVNKCIFM